MTPTDSYEAMAARLNDEAQRLFSQGQYVAAEQSVQQLLELVEHAVGTENPDYAMGLSMFGELRFLLEDLHSAESLFRRSLEIRGRVFGYWHPDYAVSLACLGGVLWRLGAMEEAERNFRQAMAIRYEVLGERHPESIQSRKELARLLRRRGDWAGAQALTRAAVGKALAESINPSERDLTEVVVKLSGDLRELGERLLPVARQMKELGAPPPIDCVERLDAVVRGFDSLRHEALLRIDELQVPGPQAEMVASHQDLAALLDDLAELEVRHNELEVIRHRSLSILDRILSLSYGKGEPFGPLLECQERVGQLRATVSDAHWMQLPSQTERLAEGDHALVKLLALVENLSSLSDRSWADLHEMVSETLGRPLASAASRGKLISRSTPERPVPWRPVPSEVARPSGMTTDRRRAHPAAATAPVALDPGSATEGQVGGPVASPPTTPAQRSSGQGRRVAAGRIAEGDPSSTLLRDLAVASLVPSMGRVINLPSDSPSEVIPHRLLRVGHAPAVVERPAPGTMPPATPAADPQPAGSRGPRVHLPPELARRLAIGRPVVEGVVSGPLPLLQGFGQAHEHGQPDELFPHSIWNSSFQREDMVALIAKGTVEQGSPSDSRA